MRLDCVDNGHRLGAKIKLKLIGLISRKPPPDVIKALRDAGAGPEAIETVVHVCAAFNIIDRIADSLDFNVQTDAQCASDAKMLLSRGYE